MSVLGKTPGKLAIARLPLTFWSLLRCCAATGIRRCQNTRATHEAQDDPYDAAVDFARSLDACYAEIRARVAAGGEGWKPR